MSIHAVGSVGDIEYSPTDSTFIQRALSFRALGKALGSGDIASARQAYSTFMRLTPLARDAEQDPDNTFYAIFFALGEALDAGDTQRARNTFTKIQQDIQRAEEGVNRHQSNTTTGTNTGRRIIVSN